MNETPSMSHIPEDQLVLYYYGESGEQPVESHLALCEHCRSHYRSLQRVLNAVDSYPVPDRAPDFETRLWQQLQPRLAVRRSGFLSIRYWAAAAAVTCAMLMAFYLGRLSSSKPAPSVVRDDSYNSRVLLSAVGNHLDRTQYLLIELANNTDLQSQQADLRDLIESNRLYRSSASQAGEPAVAEVLDELERLLVEVAHLAPKLSPAASEELRERILNKGILFRIRVTGTELRDREKSL